MRSLAAVLALALPVHVRMQAPAMTTGHTAKALSKGSRWEPLVITLFTLFTLFKEVPPAPHILDSDRARFRPTPARRQQLKTQCRQARAAAAASELP